MEKDLQSSFLVDILGAIQRSEIPKRECMWIFTNLVMLFASELKWNSEDVRSYFDKLVESAKKRGLDEF